MGYKPPLRQILRASKVHGRTAYDRRDAQAEFRRQLDDLHAEGVEDMQELAHYFANLEKDFDQSWEE